MVMSSLPDTTHAPDCVEINGQKLQQERREERGLSRCERVDIGDEAISIPAADPGRLIYNRELTLKSHTDALRHTAPLGVSTKRPLG
jgi:hypothetical protein